MKNTLKNTYYKLGLLQLALLSGVAAFAQDSTANSTSSQTVVTHTSSTAADNTQAMWYTSPWVWVGGALLLIILLYAILKGNNSNNRTEVTRTVKTSTEVKND